MRSRPRIAFYRERLELSDGDFVDLDWSLTQAGVIASANAAGDLIGAIIANRIATRIGTLR